MDFIKNIEAKIATRTAELAELNKTEEQIEAARIELDAVFEQSKIDGELNMEAWDAVDAAAIAAGNLINELDGLRNTLRLAQNDELILVDTDFLITNVRNLVSPSGFHPEERVFIKGETNIRCNVLPKNVVGLWAHDMRKLGA